MKRGLVLGKFMPLHNEDIHLIETAAQQVDELTVLVCSSENEPIPGVLRYHWMKEQFPELRVLHVTDENFLNDQLFLKLQTDIILRNCPNGLDVIFSSAQSAQKDFELSEQLGVEHVIIYSAPKKVPISATKIRQNPDKYWEYIPAVVRPYFIKRVVLTGPESTGKSVLAKKLAEHYNTVFVEEYGRTYCEKFGTDLDAMDFAHIAGGQLLREDEAARKANRILFCDTDLMVTQIWAEIYFKHCPQWILEMNHYRKYDLFLLMDTDIAWIDDGTREHSEVRQNQWRRLKEELESRNCPYAEIGGSFEERFEKAVQAVEEILNK